MSLELVTAPTAEPVTIDEVKRQLRIDTDDEDVLIGQAITAARRQAEVRLRRQLVSATWKLRLDCFPCWEIQVPLPPLVSVTTLQYIDTGGTTQTLTENTHFVTYKYREPGLVEPAYNQTWPSTRDVRDAVILTFVAGYGDPSDVPQDIRNWITAAVGVIYDRRELASEVTVKDVGFIDSLLMCNSWGSYA